MAFEFSEQRLQQVLSYLYKREGQSFSFPIVRIRLPDGREVNAITSAIATDAKTYVGDLTLDERTALACVARGRRGTCVEYVRNTHAQLESIGIRDAEVDRFLQALEERRHLKS